MGRLIFGTLVMAVMAGPVSASAQDESAAPHPRWAIEGAAGIQLDYDGTVQSVAFGFTPIRNLTVFARVERSHIGDRFEQSGDVFSSERGDTQTYVTGEVQYSFLKDKPVYPYVLGGIGGGRSRANVSSQFPNERERNIYVFFSGGGVRLPANEHFELFAEVRVIGSGEAVSDYFAVRMPVRLGATVRF